MSTYRVRICMPAYEPKREHMRAAVESILAQSCTDWALLINDDASKREDTHAHIADFLEDPRIRFSRNERNLGIGGNWNATLKKTSPSSGGGRGRGMEEKEAEYVAFLFHDDLWEPTYLEKMLAALEEHPTAGFAAADHTYVQEGAVRTFPLYDELRAFKQQEVQPGLHNRTAFLRWWLARGLHPNVIGEPSFVVLRRSLMEQVGPFHETMVQFLDIEYWVRCLLCADWVYVDQELGSFRVHPSGMSAVNERMGRGIFERLETLETVADRLPRGEKAHARRAIVRAVSEMIGKYLARRKEGRSVSGHGSGALKRFILRHPILLIRAGLRWLFKRS
jgi:GT2 family glycosyltransferase